MKKLTMSFHVFWLTVVVSVSLAATNDNTVLKSADEELAGFVSENAGKLKKPILAVFPFTHEDGSKSMEGELTTERLITLLSTNATVRVVERERLAKALEEQKLSGEGFVSPETAVRAGKLSGANGILVGTLTEQGETVEFHARLFSVESGEIIAAHKVTARRAIRTFINPLWDDIDRIKSSGKHFKARMWVERDRLRIGDEAKILFEVARDCYVTIFDFSTDGTIAVLFPNRFQPNNTVKAGRKYELPGEAAGYKIRARGPAGIERVKLFAVTSDVPLYERDYSQAPFSTVNDGDQQLMRGLKIAMEDKSIADWSETACEFLIENVLR